MFIIVLLITGSLADRFPNGGANCTSSTDCNSGGFCEKIFNSTISRCVCFSERGGPACAYHRYSKTTAACLQIILSIITLDGIGNLYIGSTNDGTWQLCLGLSVWILLIPLCCCLCCAKCICGEGKEPSMLVVGLWICLIATLMAGGFIWAEVVGARMLEPGFLDPNGYELV